MEIDPKTLDAARAFLFGNGSPAEDIPPDAEERIQSLLNAQRERLQELAEAPAITPVTAGSRAPRRNGNGRRETPPVELRAAGIQRVGNGWQARCRHRGILATRFAADSKHGGYVRSFLEALDLRDELYRKCGRPLPSRVEAVIDGTTVSPDIIPEKGTLIVRWRGDEFAVNGDDAEEIATEVALDLFAEFIQQTYLEDGSATHG